MEAKTPIRHILLIDDDRDDCDLFDDIVHEIDNGIQLTVFNNCFGIIHKLDNLKGIPDIIFLDINLPGKGWD